jgi:LysR family transcriptional activator of mexEF-oprN operon
MPKVYGRDLDLNLLRVFAVVAETGSVTAAAGQLYLSQPAVSAALSRLTRAVGAPLFVRSGRGIVLSARGERLRAVLQQHLQKVVEAALEPPTFDPRTSTRTVRLGLSDSAEVWLLPKLLRVLETEAPGMRVIVVPVQFRNVGTALASGAVDIAVTVADELPPSILRRLLLTTGFVCLHDPRHAPLRTLTEEVYFAHEHIIVSYNADLRGVIEDVFGKTRKGRCSVPSFAHVGALVEGSARLATIPEVVADSILAVRPQLGKKRLPFTFPLNGAGPELLWPAATDDDAPCRFVRETIIALARALPAPMRSPDALPAKPRAARATKSKR